MGGKGRKFDLLYHSAQPSSSSQTLRHGESGFLWNIPA